MTNNSKSSSQKDIQEKIKDNLESILNGIGGPLSSAGDEDTDLPDKIEHPHAQSMNFHAENAALSREAKKTLTAVIKFYVDAKYIKTNEYVQAKKKVDEMALSSIMFSLKFTQHAIIKILEEIDIGNTHPRNFEALAALNTQLLSTIKHQAAYMATIEEGYRKMQRDEISKEKVDEVNSIPGTMSKLEPVKVRGTRLLMQSIQDDLSKQEPEQRADGVMKLTDPNFRPEGGPPPKKEDDIRTFDDEYF